MPPHSDDPSTALLTTQQILDWLGFKRTKLHELRATGNFPHPVFPGGGSPRWRLADVRRWLDELEPAPTREVSRIRSRAKATRS